MENKEDCSCLVMHRAYTEFDRQYGLEEIRLCFSCGRIFRNTERVAKWAPLDD